jgi:hypothetical protein
VRTEGKFVVVSERGMYVEAERRWEKVALARSAVGCDPPCRCPHWCPRAWQLCPCIAAVRVQKLFSDFKLGEMAPGSCIVQLLPKRDEERPYAVRISAPAAVLACHAA